MHKKVIEVNDSPEWNSFVKTSAHATNYHQYEWRAVIEKSFGHKAHYLASCSDDGRISGILPLIHMKSMLFGNFLVSVPFFNYGGILCNDDSDRQALVQNAIDLRKSLGASHVELRHLEPFDIGLQAKTHKVTMILDLEQDSDKQWQAFDYKMRNHIRKAMKSGLNATIGGVELLDGYYDVFSENMRDLGTPVYSKMFFKNVLDTFPESTAVVSVDLDGSVIASGILCWYRDTIEIPWSSSIRKYRSLCPNNLMFWAAIKYAIENDFKKFDFGRSTPDEGTYNFKKQWGAKPVQLYWHYIMEDGARMPDLSPKNSKFGLAVKAWQKMPLGLTKIIGPHIVRNIP